MWIEEKQKNHNNSRVSLHEAPTKKKDLKEKDVKQHAKLRKENKI